jgi:hypothetical protein
MPKKHAVFSTHEEKKPYDMRRMRCFIRKDTKYLHYGAYICTVLNRLRSIKNRKNKKTRFVQRLVFSAEENR